MNQVLWGTNISDRPMLPLVELPLQRMRVHIRSCRLGFNRGYQLGMTRLGNLPWIQDTVPDTFHCTRSSQPTSHTLLASDLSGARDL
jgi:hypothetical protein